MLVAVPGDPQRRLDLHNISIDFAAAQPRAMRLHPPRQWTRVPAAAPPPRTLRPATSTPCARPRPSRTTARAATQPASRLLAPGPQPASGKKEPEMSHQIQAAPRPARASLVPRRHLPRIRQELEQERRFRLDQIDVLAAETAKATMNADEARRQVGRALTVAAEWALGDIDAALHRLDHGTYGICERCAAPIPYERLEILPMTRWCVPCHCSNAA